MRVLRALQLRFRALDGVSRDVALLSLGFAVLRFWAVLGRPRSRYPDSDSYFYVDFFGHAAGGRPWTVPVLFTALPSDGARVFAQILIGILCWSALSFAVAKSLRHPVVARIGALLILLLGLCIQVTEWDQAILSHSLALSLTALLAATLLWLRLRRSYWTISSVLVVSVLWIFTRPDHAMIFIPIVIVASVWILVRARRYLPVVVALAAIASWGGYAAAQDVGDFRFTAHDLLFIRVFQTADGPSFFANAGMPDVSMLQKEAADYAATKVYIGGNSKVYLDPKWRAWVDRHFLWTYARWLLKHPVTTIRAPLARVAAQPSPDPDQAPLLSGFPAYGTPRPVLPSPVQDALWERGSGDVPLWIAVAFLTFVGSLRRSRPGSLDALAAGGFVVCAFWYFVVFHEVASELPRLMIGIACALRISLLLVIVAALDRIVLRQVDARPPSTNGAFEP